ncbi:MAG: tetratricopeptide repeat protein [Eubacteriales bacterium]|nr:tetratricopeptide repeat protein [Eubacteriales bacterium]
MDNEIKCKSCSKEPTDRINVMRFISRLDDCFRKNDLEEAVNTVRFWEAEATRLHDTAGLLSVLNEELGLFRRLGDRENALRAIKLTCDILDKEDITGSISRATIIINLATTMKAFGDPQNAIIYYEKAQSVYSELKEEDTYEYATLLNNKSSTLCDLKRFDEAEACLRKAIEILNPMGDYDADIALSYLSLAHLYYDRDETSTETVEGFIDTAWDYINGNRQERNSDYAFAISKCAPSFRYFCREIEALALEETAKEIYGGNL